MSDHSLVIDDVDCRPTGDVLLAGDRATHFFVPEITPSNRAILDILRERFRRIGVYPNQDKGLAFPLLNERPLEWKHATAWASPHSPKGQKHDLAPVFT